MTATNCRTPVLARVTPVRLACALAVLSWLGSTRADVFTNPDIPSAETSYFTLVYQKLIPVNSPGWNGMAVPYEVNNSGAISGQPFKRVAYYWELQKPTGGADWLYVSVDAFTADVGKLGIPNTTSGAFFQQFLSNMNVYSNVPGIVAGTGLTTGNIEFWPSNYGQNNDKGVPGASSSSFDFGDGGAGTGTGHGSMQLHNYGAAQTLFAYNGWGAARTSELGLGNQPGGSSVNPDWTFNTSNISNYTSRTLQVLVLIPEPASLTLLALGSLLLRRRRG